MMNFLDAILTKFRSCFGRAATFGWFVIIVIGLMTRTDNLGVTSVIRSLALLPDAYTPMIGFFRSTAWALHAVEAKWWEIIKETAPLVKLGGAVVMIGDGIKTPKEGRKMPGVKRLHQESENASKGEFIHGHMFGSIGILAGVGLKRFCIPLALRLQDGVKSIFRWDKSLTDVASRQGSHVEEMIRLAHEAALKFGRTILLLDRLFMTVPALKTLAECNAEGNMQIVTKAKSNCVAYERPETRTPGKRGRPPIKGRAIKLHAVRQPCG